MNPAEHDQVSHSIADQSIAHFWSIPRSLVYRELLRLEALGYLKGAEVPQQKLPDKREYRLTESGRAELSRWLNQPGFEKGRFKDGFLVKFFFGRHMDPASRRRLLDEYRSQAQEYLESLQAIAGKLEGVPGGEFPRLTALRGIRAVEGQLLWVDDVEQMLADDHGMRGPLVVQYWRSFADLDRFARDSADPHRPAWQRFNRNVGSSGEVGIWHETYEVRSGEYECMYGNMPRVGLAAAAEHLPIGRKTDSAAQRIGEVVLETGPEAEISEPADG